GDIAAKAAVGRRIAGAQYLAAVLREAVEHRLHILLARDVVSQREGAGAASGLALHVAFEVGLGPKAQHEAVHLEKDDLRDLENRLPAEALGIEAPGAREIGDAQRNQRHLLLHRPPVKR